MLRYANDAASPIHLADAKLTATTTALSRHHSRCVGVFVLMSVQPPHAVVAWRWFGCTVRKIGISGETEANYSQESR